MAKIIENTKTYEGRELETIFFRPLLSGPDARALGIHIMYNMPVPTTLQFWKRAADILKKYKKGWSGSEQSQKFQKKIELEKVKAELAYSANDYFSMVYEQITASPEVNLEDLSGTYLEEAETKLFKESIAESIRATMWIGDKSREDGFNTFNGFLKRFTTDISEQGCEMKNMVITSMTQEGDAEKLFKKMWNEAPEVLKDFKSQGNLVFLVTSDIYANYEESLDSAMLENAYMMKQEGRQGLMYKGIPVVDVQIAGYLSDYPELPQSFAVLTDKRNLALAVNTADYPGMEVRMWYNPDEMENRQRAVFMAGCDYLLPELTVFAYTE